MGIGSAFLITPQSAFSEISKGKGLYAAGRSFVCDYDNIEHLINCDGGVFVDQGQFFELQLEVGWAPPNYNNTGLGGVVYNDELYVFFTTTDGKIRYGTVNPGGSSAIGAIHTISSGISDHGAAAAVLRDTLYVFTTAHTFSSSDGASFAVSDAGPPPQAGRMLDAVTFFPPEKGDPRIMLVYLDGSSHLVYSIFSVESGKGSFTTPVTLPYPFEEKLRDGNLLLGTVSGHAKELAIQFYGSSEGKKLNPLLPNFNQQGRWEYLIAENKWFAPPADTPFVEDQYFLAASPWFEKVNLDNVTTNDGVVRNNVPSLHLMHKYTQFSANDNFATNFSDYLIPYNYNPNEDDAKKKWYGLPTPTASATGDTDKAQKLRNLWTLVGVVLGPPPYFVNPKDANSAVDPNIISEVDYGTTDSTITSEYTSISQTISVGSELSIQGGLGEASLDFSYAHGWSSSQDKSEEVDVSTTYQFGPPSDTPPYGQRGWVLFNAPVLLTQRYKIYAYDHSTYLGQDMYTTIGGGAGHQVVYFNLQKPYIGQYTDLLKDMTAYWYSNDLAHWLNIRDWNAGGSDWSVKFGDLSDPIVNPLSQGTSTVESYTQSNTDTTQTDNSNSFSVDAATSFDFFEGFSAGISVGYSTEFDTSSTVQTTVSENVTLYLEMKQDFPPYPEDYVHDLQIQPYWLQAKTNQAPWIPSGYNGNLPWVITWNVTGYKIGPDSTAGIAPSPVSASGLVQTGQEQADSYRVETGFLAWQNSEGATIPLAMTADDFDPDQGALVSLNGRTFAADGSNLGQWVRSGEQWIYRSPWSLAYLIQDVYHQPAVFLPLQKIVYAQLGVDQNPFELILDFGAGTWTFESTAKNLERIFPVAERSVRVDLELQGKYRFSQWLQHQADASWSFRDEDQSLWEPYGVHAMDGAYDSGSETGYVELTGHIPENEFSFGDVQLILNGSGVSIPLLSTDDFLVKLENRDVVTYEDGGLFFSVDFSDGLWELRIEPSEFKGDMAPRQGEVRMQMLVGGAPVSDQIVPIKDYSLILNFLS